MLRFSNLAGSHKTTGLLKFYHPLSLGFLENPRSSHMRIDGFQNIPALLQSYKADSGTGSSPGNGTEGPASSVSLSSFGEILQSLQRESAHSAKARAAHVDRLAQKNQSGGATVDIDKLASSLVDLQIVDAQDNG